MNPRPRAYGYKARLRGLPEQSRRFPVLHTLWEGWEKPANAGFMSERSKAE